MDILYMHAGFSSDLIDSALANGAEGLVIAGVGNGNMTSDAQAAVRRATQAGVVVVRSSRVGWGVAGRDVEIDDDELGTVAALDLNPGKARVLLKLALLQDSDPQRIQRLFAEY